MYVSCSTVSLLINEIFGCPKVKGNMCETVPLELKAQTSLQSCRVPLFNHMAAGLTVVFSSMVIGQEKRRTSNACLFLYTFTSYRVILKDAR